MEVLRHDFDSWTAFVDAAEKAQDTIPEWPRSSRRKEYGEWFLTRDFTEAVKVARDFEWPKYQSRVRDITAGITDRITGLIEQPEIVYDYVGEQWDIGAVLSGEPEVWQREESRFIDGVGTKIHHIVFNGSTSGGITPEAMANKGIMVAALVNCLEMAGRRVKVTLCFSLRDDYSERDSKYQYEIAVTLKQPEQPIDIDRLTVALAHPSTFRRLGFAHVEALPKEWREGIGRAYGYPVAVQEPSDIRIDELMYQDDENAREQIKTILKEQGIHIKGE